MLIIDRRKNDSNNREYLLSNGDMELWVTENILREKIKSGVNIENAHIADNSRVVWDNTGSNIRIKAFAFRYLNKMYNIDQMVYLMTDLFNEVASVLKDDMQTELSKEYYEHLISVISVALTYIMDTKYTLKVGGTLGFDFTNMVSVNISNIDLNNMTVSKAKVYAGMFSRATYKPASLDMLYQFNIALSENYAKYINNKISSIKLKKLTVKDRERLVREVVKPFIADYDNFKKRLYQDRDKLNMGFDVHKDKLKSLFDLIDMKIDSKDIGCTHDEYRALLHKHEKYVTNMVDTLSYYMYETDFCGMDLRYRVEMLALIVDMIINKQSNTAEIVRRAKCKLAYSTLDKQAVDILKEIDQSSDVNQKLFRYVYEFICVDLALKKKLRIKSNIKHRKEILDKLIESTYTYKSRDYLTLLMEFTTRKVDDVNLYTGLTDRNNKVDEFRIAWMMAYRTIGLNVVNEIKKNNRACDIAFWVTFEDSCDVIAPRGWYESQDYFSGVKDACNNSVYKTSFMSRKDIDFKTEKYIAEKQ